MEIEQLHIAPSFTERLKSVPKKYWIIAGIILIVIIAIITVYFIGKKSEKVNHAKPKVNQPDIQDAEIEDIEKYDLVEEKKSKPESKPKTKTESKPNKYLTENLSEAEIFGLDIAGKISWKEGCNYLDMPKTTYFRHKDKYKKNNGKRT
jgi:hypothetical protein